MRRLRSQFWIIDQTESQLVISDMKSNIIKIEHSNPPQLKRYLLGEDVNLDHKDIESLEQNGLIIQQSAVVSFKSISIHSLHDEGLDLSESLSRDIQPLSPHTFIKKADNIYVVIVHKPDYTLLQQINSTFHAQKVTWLPIGLTEIGRLTFGPLIIPDETPCYECFVNRRVANNENPRDSAILFNFDGVSDLGRIPTHALRFLLNLLEMRTSNFSDVNQLIHSNAGIITSISSVGSDMQEDYLEFNPRCRTCNLFNSKKVDPWFSSVK